MMALVGVLGVLAVLAAFAAWWKSNIERAARARFDAEVSKKRVDDAKATETQVHAAVDARTAADASRTPVDVAEDLIAAARRREGR